MSLWNKIVLGAKFMFGGFESASDYALGLLNEYIASGKVAERIAKAREYAATVLRYLRKYDRYCPPPWVEDYKKLVATVQALVDALEDGKVTRDEIATVSDTVQIAIAEWMK